MSNAELREIDFTLLSTEDLVKLGEDFVRSLSFLTRDPPRSRMEEDCTNLISGVVSRAGTSPTSLPPQDSAALAETFSQGLRLLHLSDPFMRDLWIRLYVHAILRGSHVFPGLELCNESPAYEPLGFADTWKARYHGSEVCIKVVRTPTDLERIKRTFYHEVEGCKHFSHPNTLSVLRISETLFPLCIMSPWMPSGNIIQYVQKNQDVNRLMLLAETCNGLLYLHGLDISHGRIAPGNVLITRGGRACLSDFGIAGASIDLSFPRFKLGTARYMAPERLGHPNDRSPSKKGDIYSLAMTSFTVLTGILPYDGVRDQYSLIFCMKSGELPTRPTNPGRAQWLQDSIWDMFTACWSKDLDERWDASAMRDLFLGLSLQKDVKIGGRERASGRILPRVASFFRSPETKIKKLLNKLLRPVPEINRLVDEMDGRLEGYTMSDRERMKLLNELCKTCGKYLVLPKSVRVPGRSKDVTESGYAEEPYGASQGTHERQRVAVKVIPVFSSNLDATLSGFCREVVAWKHLRHPNVLPLLGVTVSEDRFAMVSKWMNNGNINEFVRRDHHADRIALLVDIANGLKYIHDLRIVHGDLKGANILINEDKRACIADFSLTTVIGVGTNTTPGVSLASAVSDDTLVPLTAVTTFRWMSPELLDPEQFGVPRSEAERPTRQSDCYALGMVIYEVLCGHHPFIETQTDSMVVVTILDGGRPPKPEGAARLGFNNELWMMVERCWKEDRAERPNAEEILTCLNNATAFWYMKGF